MSRVRRRVAEKLEEVVLDILRDSEHLDDAILYIGENLRKGIDDPN